MRKRAASKLYVYLLGALTVVVTACGGGTPEPEPYSNLCSAATDEVSIPDAALLAVVRAELDIASGPITCADMEGLTRLFAEGAGIADLAGLQYATNLADVNLTNNDITSIAPLAALTQIFALNLNVNPITSLEPLRNLTNLVDLHLCCNPNDFEDISPLEGLTKMQRINLGGFGLGDAVMWPLLARYPDLEGLWIAGNQLTDFGQLANYPNARFLALDGSVISDLSVVSALDKLIWLELSNTFLGDLTPLHSMTQLEVLNLSSTGIDDLDFLADFHRLKVLDLRSNAIRSLAPLIANSALGTGARVDVRWNPLDLDAPEVQDDIAALQTRGVDLQYGGVSPLHLVEPAVPAPISMVSGLYPAAQGMFGALTRGYRVAELEEGEWQYTFLQPFLPFPVGADGAFNVTLPSDPELRTDDVRGSCDFSGLTNVFISPFFGTEVTEVYSSTPPLPFVFDTTGPAYFEDFWYSSEDRHLKCRYSSSGTTAAGIPTMNIYEYDLLLTAGWNSTLRYIDALPGGQRYYSFRTGTMAADGVLRLVSPP